MTNNRRLESSRRLATVAAVVVAACSACFTGARPKLVTEATIPRLDDSAIGTVAEILAAGPPDVAFTVDYTIVTKLGGQTTTARLANDPLLGTSLVVAEVRYVWPADGQRWTCSTITNECESGIDETRVSDRQLTSEFWGPSIVERLRQDVSFAVRDADGRAGDVAGRTATCVDVPVVDSSGSPRTKSYCAFDSLGVVAMFDTADLTVTATAVTDSADPASFSV